MVAPAGIENPKLVTIKYLLVPPFPVILIANPKSLAFI